MIDTAIVLAGGFGTRLAAVVSDVPKPMAPIAGRPFLERLLDQLARQGVRHVILAVGHKREIIRAHFGEIYADMVIRYSEETTPLGTGGAMRQAFEQFALERALVLNGDTFCPVDLAALSAAHARHGAAVTLTLVKVEDASRYGAVSLTVDGRVEAFHEKRAQRLPGLINAGIYAVERRAFALAGDATAFSFEQTILQTHAASESFHGHVARAFFIDIGVPEDYQRAQTELVACE